MASATCMNRKRKKNQLILLCYFMNPDQEIGASACANIRAWVAEKCNIIKFEGNPEENPGENREWTNWFVNLAKIEEIGIKLPIVFAMHENVPAEIPYQFCGRSEIMSSFCHDLQVIHVKFVRESWKVYWLVTPAEQRAFAKEVSKVVSFIVLLTQAAEKEISYDYYVDSTETQQND